jgi:TonB family protein
MKVMSCFRFKLQSVVFLFVLASSLQLSFGQAAPKPDWETLRPEQEDFSVLMPKGSTSEATKEPYHKMELNVRTYLSNSPSGIFAVVSMSGIKSNPAQYTEMQRVNSYVDAFKDIFAPKIKKGAIAKLSLVGDKTLFGHAGREYRMTLGDLSGKAEVYATRKRFYSIVYLNTKPNDELRDEFLSSFVLPEKINTPANTAAAEAAPATEATAKAAEATSTENPPTNDNPPGKKPEEAKSTDKKRPISGGVLNGKAITLPKPEYPADANAGEIEGVVVVNVTVDEQGNVSEAYVVSGPKALQQACLNAALQAKFSPTLLSGEPVKVTGVLVFNFGRPLS